MCLSTPDNLRYKRTLSRGKFLGTYGQAVKSWLELAIQRAHWTGSNRALARKAGIPNSTLHQMLSGEGNPQADKIAAVARALDQEGPTFALGDAEPPRTLSGLIGQAQWALDEAQRLIANLERPAASVQKTAKRAGRVKGPQPDGAEKGRGAA